MLDTRIHCVRRLAQCWTPGYTVWEGWLNLGPMLDTRIHWVRRLAQSWPKVGHQDPGLRPVASIEPGFSQPWNVAWDWLLIQLCFCCLKGVKSPITKAWNFVILYIFIFCNVYFIVSIKLYCIVFLLYVLAVIQFQYTFYSILYYGIHCCLRCSN